MNFPHLNQQQKKHVWWYGLYNLEVCINTKKINTWEKSQHIGIGCQLNSVCVSCTKTLNFHIYLCWNCSQATTFHCWSFDFILCFIYFYSLDYFIVRTACSFCFLYWIQQQRSAQSKWTGLNRRKSYGEQKKSVSQPEIPRLAILIAH